MVEETSVKGTKSSSDEKELKCKVRETNKGHTSSICLKGQESSTNTTSLLKKARFAIKSFSTSHII